jgi:hypothetical protein
MPTKPKVEVVKSTQNGRKPKKKKSGPMPRRAKTATSGTSGLVRKHHTVAACSILDPFCISARAAKRPDGAGSGTITYQVRSSTPVTTDAAGNAFIAIVPGYGRFGRGIATLSAGSWTLPASWTLNSASTFVDTNAAEIRIVSQGAKFVSIASATNCSGLLQVASIPAVSPSQVFLQMNVNYPEVVTSALLPGTELSWIAKPSSGGKAHNFVQYSSVSSTMTDFDWTAGIFEIIGGTASTTMGYIEIYVNVEFTLNSVGITTTGLSGNITKSRPANPIALQVQSQVHSNVSSIIEGGVKAVEKTIYNAAADVVSSLPDFGLSALFGML